MNSIKLAKEIQTLRMAYHRGIISEAQALSVLKAFKDIAQNLGWEEDRGYGKLRAIGRDFKIPECCIDEFISDIKKGLSPAELRGLISNSLTEYVPCKKCKKNSFLFKPLNKEM
jgi:hypothetical protein